jgi:hypothetical protein
MEKHNIELIKNCDYSGENGESMGMIKRVLRQEMCGNFAPIFCTYKGQKWLVKSKAGDLSDPFRRENSYANSLFIDLDKGQK